MLYNIYSNLSNEQFLSLSKELEIIEGLVTDLFAKEGYSISTPVSKSDGLIIDAGKIVDDCYTNISVTFDDLPNEIPRFSVGFLKAIDIDGKRFYKKGVTAKNVDIFYLKENIRHLIRESINVASKVDKEELRSSDFLMLQK